MGPPRRSKKILRDSLLCSSQQRACSLSELSSCQFPSELHSMSISKLTMPPLISSINSQLCSTTQMLVLLLVSKVKESSKSSALEQRRRKKRRNKPTLMRLFKKSQISFRNQKNLRLKLLLTTSLLRLSKRQTQYPPTRLICQQCPSHSS